MLLLLGHPTRVERRGHWHRAGGLDGPGPWDEWLIVWGYDINGPEPELDDEKATEIIRDLLGMPDLEPEITGYSLWGVQ